MTPVTIVDCRASYGASERDAIREAGGRRSIVLQMWRYTGDRWVFGVSVLGLSGVEFPLHLIQELTHALATKSSPRGWPRVMGPTPHLISIRPLDDKSADRLVTLIQGVVSTHPGLHQQWLARYGGKSAEPVPASESQSTIGGTTNG